MKNITLSLILFSALFTTSCNRYYYKPNAVNAPLFTDKGQAHLNFAGSIGGSDQSDEQTNFFDVQASVSPIKHLGIIANYSTYNYNTLYPDTFSGNVNARAFLLEGGIGGYYAMGERKVKFVLDIYGGAGFGNMMSDVDMNVTRIFLQPGIGLTSPWFDFSFNPRVSHISYSNFDANGYDDQYLRNQGLIDPLTRRIDSRSYLFFEPTFTIRGGYKFAKFQLQGAFATPVSVIDWNYNGARFTAGVYLQIESMIELAKYGAKGRSDN